MMFAQVKRDIEAIEAEEKRAAQGTTIAELVGLYTHLHIEKRDIRAATRDALKPIVANLGHLEPEGVTSAVWAEYEASRKHHLTGKPISSSSLRRQRKALNAVVNWAHVHGFLAETRRLPRIVMPQENPARESYLDVHEQDAFQTAADVFDAELGLFIAIALSVGARSSSIEQLDWARVDWPNGPKDSGFIDFRFPGERETKKRRVKLPISKKLLPRLQRAWLAAGRPTKGRVFRRREIKYTFERFRATIGREDICPHDLRRSCAIRMARAGVSMHEIARVLGDTVAVVEKHYLHLAPEHLIDAVNAEGMF
jgi:integrase